jgi:hypothetical protein
MSTGATSLKPFIIDYSALIYSPTRGWELLSIAVSVCIQCQKLFMEVDEGEN